MVNFGFTRLSIVAPYEPHWREARSAVGAPELLASARQTTSLAEAVEDCTLVLGTGTLTHRKAEQPVVRLDELSSLVEKELNRGGQVAIIFGPEKHGLTRDDLSYCHILVEIPTDVRQPSMNLGQAAAVCLYELATRVNPATQKPGAAENSLDHVPDIDLGRSAKPSDSGNLDILGGLIEQVMVSAGYSPRTMQKANQHDLRLALRRLHLNAADSRRALGLFRRILWRFKRTRT
jgi:TrmH family RNA methyltransferase